MVILENFIFKFNGTEKPILQGEVRLNSGFTAVLQFFDLIVVSYFNIVMVLWLFLLSSQGTKDWIKVKLQ